MTTIRNMTEGKKKNLKCLTGFLSANKIKKTTMGGGGGKKIKEKYSKESTEQVKK